MLDAPARAFGSVVSFLKMEASEEVVARAIEQTSFSALQAVEQERGFRERPLGTKAFFRSGRQGQWRGVLADSQIARIASANEGQMRRFGYWLPEFDDLLVESSGGKRLGPPAVKPFACKRSSRFFQCIAMEAGVRRSG